MSRVSEGKIINTASSDLVLLDYAHFVVIHLLFEPFVAVVDMIFLGLVIGYDVIWGFIVMLLDNFTPNFVGHLFEILQIQIDCQNRLKN